MIIRSKEMKKNSLIHAKYFFLLESLQIYIYKLYHNDPYKYDKLENEKYFEDKFNCM